jgi:signal transduction histidine kinase
MYFKGPKPTTNLQFFSRYSYTWKFDKDQEAKYDLFVRSSQLTSLRLVTFITIFGTSIFLIIDFFKDVDFSVVLITRLVVLATAIVIMWVTYKEPGSGSIVFLVIVITLLNFSSAMVTANFARMPPYYITNLLFLIFVLVVTASGLHFRYAFFLNLFCFSVFIFYSQFIRREPFYFTQYPHLFSIFLYIHIVGIVLESRRRKNFLQFNDLMEQKRLVDELNQQKNKIISILSHDVAAPMNSLSTLLYLYSKENIKGADLRSFLPKLSDQFNSVSILLFSLVRWSRSQMEGFVLDKTISNLVELVEREVRFFHLQLLDKGLEIKLTAPSSLYVKVDEEMIRIGLRNLISNAIKFSRSGTSIQLKVYKNEQNKALISIVNFGEQIPPELVDKLFTYQMSSTADSKGEKGTGLGLAMTAFFVRLNGGDIYLAPSEPGTINFCIEIPEAMEQPVSA